MYHLTGFRENLNNVRFLAKSGRFTQRAGFDLDKLKLKYQGFLKSIQPAVTVGQAKKIQFVRDLAMVKRLIKFYFANPDQKEEEKKLKKVVDSFQDLPERDQKILLLKEGYNRIHQIDNQWGALLNLVVNKVFYFNCEGMGGGSTPFAFGIVWASPSSSWGADDFVEFYAHELSHQLMFLDDECYRHYTDYDQLKLEKNYAISAIRNSRRRIDLTMHSLVVGVEIILLREKVLGHPKNPVVHPITDQLIENCRETIHSIESIPQWRTLFSKRGIEILSRCQEVLSSFRAHKKMIKAA